MRILLFGRNGQLGWELQRSLAPLGEIIALSTHSSPAADFTRPSQVAATVRAVAPDVIVNAAAYTAVDQAEIEPQIAMAVNAITPAVLAEFAVSSGAWLVHYSTDYVFNGEGNTPWREDAPVAPLNVYGRSKLAGEQSIRASACKHLIFRTSWVYSTRGNNFAKTMLRLAQEREALEVVDDQFGVPTGADLLADVTAHALRIAFADGRRSGTYHLVPSGETSWYNYARHVIARAREAGLPIKVADADIRAVSTQKYSTPAMRPLNSRLSTIKIRDTFGLHLPHWKVGVDRMLTEIL